MRKFLAFPPPRRRRDFRFAAAGEPRRRRGGIAAEQRPAIASKRSARDRQHSARDARQAGANARSSDHPSAAATHADARANRRRCISGARPASSGRRSQHRRRNARQRRRAIQRRRAVGNGGSVAATMTAAASDDPTDAARNGDRAHLAGPKIVEPAADSTRQPAAARAARCRGHPATARRSSADPREGTQPPLRADSRTARTASATGTPTGATTIATTGAAGATITGRTSTSAFITIRSAGIISRRDRLAAVAELLQQPLLDQRSVAYRLPYRAAGHALDSLLGRRPAGRHVHRRGRGRDPQLLLVDAPGPLVEGALRPCRGAPLHCGIHLIPSKDPCR